MRRYQALDLLQAVIKQLENVILPSCFAYLVRLTNRFTRSDSNTKQLFTPSKIN